MAHDKPDRRSSGTPVHANRLAGEKSPYLRQHAGNPVDWYPWGDEAFARAAAEGRPVFLSIGYSTCHWCHVMARESFEDTEVARLLNESFVSIKVDREERPDIDRVYMAACQLMTGAGGWPLSVFLTPGKEPFFATTYIPRESRFGSAGMLDLLPGIAKAWKERKADLAASAVSVSETLAAFFRQDAAGREPGPALLTEAYESLVPRFDTDYGGFDAAPKFPLPPLLVFLLRYWKRTGTDHALAMVTRTLDNIRRGGIYDQLGGGVHRYSTDARWQAPHFEKMLYDQALLAIVFTEAFQATGTTCYRKTATEILSYLLRDLRSPEGAFFSAEDADSGGAEGAFYLWDNRDLTKVLGERDAAIARAVFSVQGGDPSSGPEETGDGTVLNRNRSLDSLAGKSALSREDLASRIEAITGRLFLARQERPRPIRDEKVLADMNGLAIAALAKAAQAFGDERYTAAAGQAVDFILERMRMPDGGLYHRYCCGEPAVAGFAEDYAGMVFGLIELFEATFCDRYLASALDLNRYLVLHFHDPVNGGFFSTADRAEDLPVRTKDGYDGVVPSANSLILFNLLRLSRLAGRPEYEQLASRAFLVFGAELEKNPSAHAFFLAALDYATGNPAEVIIAGSPYDEGTQALVKACRTGFRPSLLVRLVDGTGTPGTLQVAGDIAGYRSAGGNAAAYVCMKQACSAPVTDPVRLRDLLDQVPVVFPAGHDNQDAE